MNHFISRPLVEQTLRWLWRASITRVFVIMFLISALVPEDVSFQGSVIFLPTMFGSLGIGPGIRQDCTDLILSRPLRRYQFVLSKWLAFLALVVLACSIHAVSSIVTGVPITKTAAALLSLLCSGAISSAAGAMTRMIILDPRRQGICVIVSLLFGFDFVVGLRPELHGSYVALRRFLFPASFAVSGTAAVSLHDILGTAINIVVLLAIGCAILYRQEFSYSLD